MLTTFDFETHGIEPRPTYPPAPLGVGMKIGTEPARWYGSYLSLKARFKDSKQQLLAHNAAFDVAVAVSHLGVAWPAPERIEDTMVLCFLADPYSRIGLKQAAHRYAGIAPAARDELREWMRDRGHRYNNWAAHLHVAAADKMGRGNELLGRYCVADVEATHALFTALAPVREAQLRCYRDELATLEPVEKMAQRGIPIDILGLTTYRETIMRRVQRLSLAVRDMLGDRNLSTTARGGLADALEAAGLVDPKAWKKTQHGSRKTSADDLRAAGCPEKFVEPWEELSTLRFNLKTFIDPWLAKHDSGRVFPNWRAIGNEEGGAKTARLSSSPNMQNITKDGELRAFVKAPAGRTFVCGDISQQEPRITAHFAGGALAKRYRDDPKTDLHSLVSHLMGVDRKVGKVLNLAMSYALGLDKLAGKLGVPRSKASLLRESWRRSLHEIYELDLTLRRHWAKGGEIETWGGARVRCSPSTEERSFEYRALNMLIQRSAAEQLKRCIRDLDVALPRSAGTVLTAHDEVLVECDIDHAKKVSKIVREALEDATGWDVPFVAEIGVGKTWKEAKP